MKLLLAILLLSLPLSARDPAVRRAFQKSHPCPSTNKRYGKCPNYVADHIIPLCANGRDTVANLQWQTVRDAKAKDKIERRQCRILRAR